jgi:arylsulfatase A-like enzyme
MDRPNVLFVVFDSLRADALGVLGNPHCKTPNMDRLAREGAALRRCFAQNPVCAPSRAAILTGWYPHVRGHRSFTYHIQPDEENLFKYFKRAGYRVTAAGTNDCLHEDSFPDSLDEWMAVSGAPMDGQKGHLADDPVTRRAFLSGRLTEEQGRDRNRAIKERTVACLRDEAPAAPWFHYAAFHIPHPKYNAPEPWYSMYDPDDMPDPIACGYEDKQEYMEFWHRLSNMDRVDARTVKQIRAIYYGMVSLADQYLGELMNALDESGRAENTVVVVLADHGDYTGDYGLVEKGQASVHDCIVNVPLLIRAPGAANIRRGEVHTALAETIDVLPTLLELADIPLAHNQYGRSLLPLLRGETETHKDAVFIEGGYNPEDRFALTGVRMADSAFLRNPDSVYGPRELAIAERPELIDRFACVRTASWKYVQRGTGPDELYDLETDPEETVNLAARGECADMVRAMKDRLLAWYLRTSDSIPYRIDDRLCAASWTPEGGLRK